jgi:hypothetical protein
MSFVKRWRGSGFPLQACKATIIPTAKLGPGGAVKKREDTADLSGSDKRPIDQNKFLRYCYLIRYSQVGTSDSQGCPAYASRALVPSDRRLLSPTVSSPGREMIKQTAVQIEPLQL